MIAGRVHTAAGWFTVAEHVASGIVHPHNLSAPATEVSVAAVFAHNLHLFPRETPMSEFNTIVTEVDAGITKFLPEVETGVSGVIKIAQAKGKLVGADPAAASSAIVAVGTGLMASLSAALSLVAGIQAVSAAFKAKPAATTTVTAQAPATVTTAVTV